MVLYMKKKKFPEFSLSFENSAGTIDKCKHELFKGVERLNKAIDSTKVADVKSKELNQQFLQKLKVQNDKEEQIGVLKKEKEDIKSRIL